MKKSLIMVMLTLVLSMTTTAFAAAQGFEKVPAQHWTYTAVSELLKDGIIDEYTGNTITRYEMAILTAQAIQKYETATDDDKALIDKLSIEFASELNTLGARTGKNEKNKAKAKAVSNDKFTFSGSTKTEWITERDDNKGTRATKFKSEVKLNTLVEVDDRTTVMAGINYENRGNDTERSEKSEIELENLWVETKLNNGLTARFGSQSLALANGLFLDADGILGAKFSWKANNTNDIELFVGRDTQSDFDTEYEVSADPSRKLAYLNWGHSTAWGNVGVYAARQEKYDSGTALEQDKFWSVYGSYALSHLATLGYERVRNTTTGITGHVAELSFGKAKNIGEWKHTVTYLNAPQGLFADEEYTDYDDQYSKYGYKGFGYLGAIRVSKAAVLSFERYWGATYNGKNKGQQFSELKLGVKF